jgi:hypothetical protein
VLFMSLTYSEFILKLNISCLLNTVRTNLIYIIELNKNQN